MTARRKGFGRAARVAAILALAAVTPALPAHAARGQIKFRKGTELDGLGLSLRLMSNAHEKPLRAPDAYTYLFSDGFTERRIEMFDPYDLWLREQHAGEWEDSFGNVLTLAEIRAPLPAGFEREHATREEYATRRRLTPAPAHWTPAALAAWVASFTRVDGVRPEPDPRPPFQFAQLIRFGFPDQDPPQLAYAFQLNPRAIGQGHVDRRWYFAWFQLEPDFTVEEADAEITRYFLHYVSTLSGPAPAGAPAPSAKFQDEDLAPQARSRRTRESRERVARSIANMEDWWFVETRHFIILSNMKVRYRSMVKDLQADLETLWEAYERLIPPRGPLSAVSVVRIFATPEEYEAFVGPEHKWTGGLWMTAAQELVIRPLSAGGSREQRERILRTCYHESFHQYIYYALNRVETDAWFNEGHAVMFENADIGNRGVRIDEFDAMADKLLTVLDDGSPSLADLFGKGYADFYGDDPEQRLRHYTLAWGLVYYLRKGVPDNRQSGFPHLLDDYLASLRIAGKPGAVLDAILSDADIEALERELESFWRSPGRRASARRRRLFP